MSAPDPAPPAASRPRIPLWIKLAYTAYVLVLVPVYWHDYGPTNFLYFCDVALLMTVPALWLENALLASAAVVGILLPQLLWQIDFLAGLFGASVTGMTDYMFKPAKPWFTRFLSFFHFWLPLFLVWVVWRLGYDRRALWMWTALAWALMLICYAWMPGPDPHAEGDPPIKINYVYGFSTSAPQTWMPGPLYLALLMVVLPAGIFFPTHLLLAKCFGSPRQTRASSLRPEPPRPLGEPGA